MSCGEEEFARRRDLVFAEASIPEIVGLPAAGPRHIEIESVPAVLANRREARRDLVGPVVSLAGIAALRVFAVDLRTILLWVMQRLA